MYENHRLLGFPTCFADPVFLCCPLMRIREAFRYFWPDLSALFPDHPVSRSNGGIDEAFSANVRRPACAPAVPPLDRRLLLTPDAQLPELGLNGVLKRRRSRVFRSHVFSCARRSCCQKSQSPACGNNHE